VGALFAEQTAIRIFNKCNQGVHLGGDYYLRKISGVWFNFRGNSSVPFFQRQSLYLSRRAYVVILVLPIWRKSRRMCLWPAIPFPRAFYMGEGYDWTPLYSVRSGQMEGALLASKQEADSDAPYWPAQICWTYKEVWTQPAGEWIWLMRDLKWPCCGSRVVDKNNP